MRRVRSLRSSGQAFAALRMTAFCGVVFDDGARILEGGKTRWLVEIGVCGRNPRADREIGDPGEPL